MSNLIDVIDGINKLSVLLNAVCLLSSGTKQERDVSYSLLLTSAELASSLTKKTRLPVVPNISHPTEFIPPAAREIGYRISHLRRNRDMTEADLACRLNVYSDQVCQWENGNAEVPASQIVRLSEILACHPLWLLSGDATRQYPATQDHQSRYHHHGPLRSDASDRASHHAKNQLQA